MEDLAEFVVDYASKLGVTYVDVRIEKHYDETIEVMNGVPEKHIVIRKRGAGIRVLANGAWGFQSTTNLNREGLKKAAEIAFKVAKASAKHIKEPIKLAPIKVAKDRVKVKIKKDVESLDVKEKLNQCIEWDKGMKVSDEVKRTTTGFSCVKVNKLFASSEGALIRFENQVLWVFLSSFAKREGLIQSYERVEGGSGGFEVLEKAKMHETAQMVGKKSVELLDAEAAPKMEKTYAVMDPSYVALLVHEIVGHPSEADRVLEREAAWAGTTWWKGLEGQKIGSDLLTVYDDPTVEGTLGFYLYDDEGTPARCKVLIENGVLKERMHSRETAAIFGAEPNAGMRAITYEFIPLIRMSNTFIAKGDWKRDEIIEETKRGIYVIGMKQPSIDDKRYNWTISAQEGYLIENGELTKHLRDVALMAIAPEFFRSIDAVGDDLEIRSIPGCGKGTPMQGLYVGNGGPTIRGIVNVLGV